MRKKHNRGGGGLQNKKVASRSRSDPSLQGHRIKRAPNCAIYSFAERSAEFRQTETSLTSKSVPPTLQREGVACGGVSHATMQPSVGDENSLVRKKSDETELRQ